MQLQMTSQRYDRQPRQDRSPERALMKTPELLHLDATDIVQERQQRIRDRDAAPSKGPAPPPGGRRLSNTNSNANSNSNSNGNGNGNGNGNSSVNGISKTNLAVKETTITATVTATTSLAPRRDDTCQLQLNSPPPSPPPMTSTTLVSPAPRSGRAGHKLSLSIPRLLRSDWVSLEGLVQCALNCLGKEECTSISELGRGSHNSLYELWFSDSTSCAAAISNSPPQFFSARAKRSEIATMQYLYSSPLYNIPVPRIYGWDVTFDNPVGAPYILREVVRGTNMSENGRFYKLSARDKLKVIKELANVQAELSKPSEFEELGYIYQREGTDNEFYVGKMVAFPSGSEEEDAQREPYLGPYSSLPELWEARIERETLSAIGSWSQLTSDSALPSSFPPEKANPQEFGELLQLLSGLTNLFRPPETLSTLCIHHSDLAIRNVLFDEKTLKITGVIDWELASVMPLVVTGRFPNDLGWEGNEFARSLGKLGDVLEGEAWNHHYYDWTSLEGVTPPAPTDMPTPPPSPAHPDHKMQEDDYLTSRNATANGCISQPLEFDFLSEDGVPSPVPSPPLPPPPTSETSQQDLNSRATRLIELYYYRKYYASRVAARDFALTRLFIDSVAYVKFNEIVMGGAEKWFRAAEWIKEVFWRLQGEDRSVRDSIMNGKGVVRVPEVFECKCRDQCTRPRLQEVDLGERERRLRVTRGDA